MITIDYALLRVTNITQLPSNCQVRLRTLKKKC